MNPFRNRPLDRTALLTVAAMLIHLTLFGRDAALTVDVDKKGVAISPTLYGIFFEEINHAGDGGLYAELVQGRTFETGSLAAWSLRTTGPASGALTVDSEKPLNPVRRNSLRIDGTVSGPAGEVAAVNNGYWGMSFKKGAKYILSFYGRSDGNATGKIEARLEGKDGRILVSTSFTDLSPEWTRREIVLESNGTDNQGRLAFTSASPGTVWLNVVSLFPQDTWKNRPNGIRPDLAEMLAGMKPAFIRVPGGCFVEGGDYVRDAFRWKTTVVDIAHRPGHLNATWNYWTTDGLGYHEYLQMADDLGAEPLFVVNVGMSHKEVVPMDQLDEWVKDALDAIEYANGPVDSKWGKLRAENGHPEPFNLKYMEIGNENGGPPYDERYAVFYKAIKARYPEMNLIANAVVHSAPMEIIDDHLYTDPDALRAAAIRYDTYDRKGPKVFVGEYACNSGVGKGNLKGALAEAEYMMGFERNADVVVMAAYAPLFYHVNDRKWPVNLIGFDASRVFGAPSYWVQRLFSVNRGDFVLPSTLECGRETVDKAMRNGAIGVGAWGTRVEYKDVQVTRDGKVLFASDFVNRLSDWKPAGGAWEVVDGVYRQTSLDQAAWSMAGDPSWTDYTLTLKARKLGGAEGFQIPFRVKDKDNFLMLNLGGWANSLFAIERCSNGSKGKLEPSYTGSIETNRWYDIRIDVKGPGFKCWLDGKQIIAMDDAAGDYTRPLMAANANLSEKNGEVVLKVVNYAPTAQKTTVKLNGAGKVASEGTAETLSSAGQEDENTVDEPQKVVPVTKTVKGMGRKFDYVFPPNSLTILRIKAGAGGR